MKKSTWKKGLVSNAGSRNDGWSGSRLRKQKEASSGTAEDGKYNLKIMSYDFFGNPMKGDGGGRHHEAGGGLYTEPIWTSCGRQRITMTIS